MMFQRQVEGTGAAYLTHMSALYCFPLTMPSRVGVWLSLKLRVTSYTADTTRGEIQINIKTRILSVGDWFVCVCECVWRHNLCLLDTAAWW